MRRRPARALPASALVLAVGIAVAGCTAAAATPGGRLSSSSAASADSSAAAAGTSAAGTAAARASAPVYGPSADPACYAAMKAEQTLQARQGKDQDNESALDQDFTNFANALTAAAQKETRPAAAKAMTALANDYNALVESQSGAADLPDMSTIESDGMAFNKACALFLAVASPAHIEDRGSFSMLRHGKRSTIIRPRGQHEGRTFGDERALRAGPGHLTGCAVSSVSDAGILGAAISWNSSCRGGGQKHS
jgi:hypothetical protein